MQNHLVIFAKAPRIGRVKSRLAALGPCCSKVAKKLLVEAFAVSW